ncbi:MAG: TerB family tellurite resistance protein [Mesorhizobium sp.]
MVAEFLEQVKRLIDGDPAIKRVADDPVLSAELMLLFRMVLADGGVDAAEMAAFRRICSTAFGIEGESLRAVTHYLQDYGYEFTTSKALALFKTLPEARRRELARHMAEIAKADNDISIQEVELLKRTLHVLGLDAAA